MISKILRELEAEGVIIQTGKNEVGMTDLGCQPSLANGMVCWFDFFHHRFLFSVFDYP